MLFIYESVLFLGKVDIRAEVTSPDGKVTQAPVEDYTHSDGCYKVLFLGSKTGKHKGSVYVLGEDVNPEGFFFYVVTGRTHSGATFSMKRLLVTIYIQLIMIIYSKEQKRPCNTQFTILLFCFRQRSTEERRHIHTGYVLFDAKSVSLISLHFFVLI